MKKHDFISSVKGSGFIQVLVALVIVGLALAPSIGVFSRSTQLIASGRAALEAAMAAQYILDLAMEGPFMVQNMGQTIELPSPALPEAVLSERFKKRYNGKAEVKIEYDGRDPRLMWAEVKVYWTEDGRELNRVLRSARANAGDVKWK